MRFEFALLAFEHSGKAREIVDNLLHLFNLPFGLHLPESLDLFVEGFKKCVEEALVAAMPKLSSQLPSMSHPSLPSEDKLLLMSVQKMSRSCRTRQEQ